MIGSPAARRYVDRLRELARLAGRRLYVSASHEQLIVEEFRKSYLGSGVDTRWMGREAATCPLDLWIYQEIVHETRPDVVVAVASKSAPCLADICRMLGWGEVVALDPSLEPEALEAERRRISAGANVMVVVGSSFGNDRLGRELDQYGALVTMNGYMIVEDTHRDISLPPGNSSPPGDGRARSVESFLERNRDFVVDHSREKFYLTFNPGGFLRRHRR